MFSTKIQKRKEKSKDNKDFFVIKLYLCPYL